MMQDSKGIFSEYLAGKGFKASKQRYIILEEFIAIDRLLDANELFIVLHARQQRVTHATIYSAMKLFVESGIAQEIHFGDGVTRYQRATEKGATRCHGHLGRAMSPPMRNSRGLPIKQLQCSVIERKQ